MEALNNTQTLKRKWQLALRRYLVGGNKSFAYARYFGLSSQNFKKWIEIQFTAGQNWENYTIKWQLDHIVPIAFFDFEKEEDLILGWSFINIRPSVLGKAEQTGILAAKSYFKSLYEQTGFEDCRKMVEKLFQIEKGQQFETKPQAIQLNEWRDLLKTSKEFDNYDFEKINTGISVNKILEEKELLKKRGL